VLSKKILTSWYESHILYRHNLAKGTTFERTFRKAVPGQEVGEAPNKALHSTSFVGR